MLYMGLWAGMLKSYCHFWNQRPPIYLMAKFRAKVRIFKFGTKIFYLGVLGSKIGRPLSYLKSVPSNLPYCKVSCEK